MHFDLKRPCKDCPFLRGKSYLHPERAREIANYAIRDDLTFTCHKTIGRKEQHCAGALLMSEKHDRRNSMHQIAHRLGLYDPSGLDHSADIYEDAAEMADGHSKF